ncbi:ABC transporter substrate-binding protein [Rhizobium sp. TRM95796]|uniref:ABC transporter substrate-binding protein n=1 Tax=Rhizobium sp. TRM95796 TaxID=2979862 RepID=UPI0021E97676|nr:ABC transporter substrate-binding protein [Rhizobium sp. TRM95796]MCV3769080.1 ABC transporter substrate-binding protein [Rhizobium sp. TRM95796]
MPSLARIPQATRPPDLQRRRTRFHHSFPERKTHVRHHTPRPCLHDCDCVGCVDTFRPRRCKRHQDVKIALDWTPNTDHIGLFVAEAKGYFKDAGLNVRILPYTDAGVASLVSNGAADFGIDDVGLYSQRAAGADIKTPKDLDGLTYGGFGSAWENTLLSSIIRKAGGKGEFKTVTLCTSAYEALANKSVDFTLEILTREGVQAELSGAKLKEFKYSDYGVPDQYTTIIVSSDVYLKANPETAKSFLAAVKKGYAFAADKPEEAADILSPQIRTR